MNGESRVQLEGRYPPDRADLKVAYVSVLKAAAWDNFIQVEREISKAIEASGGSISSYGWDRLRAASCQCLEVFELHRRCCNSGQLPLAEDVDLDYLLRAMLNAEARLGGVSREMLIRVFRDVYPEPAKEILGTTILQRWKLHMASDGDVQYLRTCHGSEAPEENLESTLYEHSDSSGGSAPSGLPPSGSSSGGMPDDGSQACYHDWLLQDSSLDPLFPGSFQTPISLDAVPPTAKMW